MVNNPFILEAISYFTGNLTVALKAAISFVTPERNGKNQTLSLPRVAEHCGWILVSTTFPFMI